MNKKIPMVGFIIGILLLAPISVISKESSVIKTQNENNIKIQLSSDEAIFLNDAILRIENNQVKQQVLSTYLENINKDNELTVDGLSDIIELLSDYYPTDTDLYDYIDLINAIIEIVINHLLELPVTVAMLLLEDVLDIINQVKNVIEDVQNILSGGLTQAISGLIALFGDVNALYSKIKQLPSTQDEFKDYIIEKIKYAVTETLKSMAQDIADTVWEFSEPRLGYISKFAVSIVDLVTTTEEFVTLLSTKIEHYKTVFIDLPKAFMELKNAPKEEMLDKLIEFSGFILSSIDSITYVISDLTDQQYELIDEGTRMLNELTYLSDYYSSNPWEKPITIQGNVTNILDGEAIIGFADPEQTDSMTITEDGAGYSIEYITATSQQSYLYHTFIVKATSGDKEKTFERTAFSDGIIELPIDFNKGKSKQMSIILEMIGNFLLNLRQYFKQIINKVAIC